MIRVATFTGALCATLHSVPALADSAPSSAPVPPTLPTVVAAPEPPSPGYVPSAYYAPSYTNGYYAPNHYSTGEDRRAAVLPADDVVPRQDWRITGYLGGFGDPHGGGVAAGASFRYRTGLFVVGGTVEDGAKPFGYEYWGGAAMAGLALRPERHVRLELLGSLGEHFYEDVGYQGTKGSMGYAGARTTLSYAFGRHLGHFELGAYADFQDDLTRRVAQEPATPPGTFFLGESSDTNFGTTRFGFGLEIGGSHDIF